jgi:tRNA U38,U39,U40 pseudouridine synthase TruA
MGVVTSIQGYVLPAMVVICRARGMAFSSHMIRKMLAASCMVKHTRLRKEAPELQHHQMENNHRFITFYC